MIVVSCDEIPGYRLVRTVGFVKGSAVRARPIFRDIMASLRLLVGGEIPEYTKMIAETREQALDRMMQDAARLGANAIINARFSTASISAATAEILVYGTAVIIEDCPPRENTHG